MINIPVACLRHLLEGFMFNLTGDTM